MLFSGGACSRRVSLFKAVLFSAKMRKARERERERVGSWERAGEFCRRRCFVLWECRGRRKEAKKTHKVFLGNEEKERIFFNFSIFFLETRIQNTQRA